MCSLQLLELQRCCCPAQGSAEVPSTWGHATALTFPRQAGPGLLKLCTLVQGASLSSSCCPAAQLPGRLSTLHLLQLLWLVVVAVDHLVQVLGKVCIR